MNNNQNSCYIFSNGQTSLFENNTLQSFKNTFPQSLLYERENWEVCLKSFGIDLNFASYITKRGVPSIAILSKYSKHKSLSQHILQHTIPRTHVYLQTNRWSVETTLFFFKHQYEITEIGKFAQLTTVRDAKGDKKILLKNKIKLPIFFVMHVDLSRLFLLENAFLKLKCAYDTFKSENFYIVQIKPKGRIYGDILPSLGHRNIPKIIKIKCNIINPYNSSDKKCKSICEISAHLECLNDYCIESFDHPQFYNLEKSQVDTISIEFLDENDEKLRLFDGTASFVHLIFKKRNKMTDYITFRASSKVTHINQANTQNNFITTLHTPINIKKGAQISVSSIMIPTKIAVIPKEVAEKPFYIQFPKNNASNNDFTEISFKIDDGYYSSKEDLLSNMNKCLHKALKDNNLLKWRNKIHFHLKYEEYFHISKDFYTNEKNNIEIGIKIPDVYKRILGFVSIDPHQFINNYLIFPPSNENIIFQESMLINDFYPNYAILYCEEILPSFVGGHFSTILRIIPIKDKNVYHTEFFENENWVELNTQYIESLHFKLTSHDGTDINFLSNLPIQLLLNIKP